MSQKPESAKLSIRGTVLVPASDGEIVIKIDRDYTPGTGVVVKKHPMSIVCEIPDALNSEFTALKKGDFIEVTGYLIPEHYVFIPEDGVVNGDRFTIPDADKPNGMARPWEITSRDGWNMQLGFCSTFRVQITEMGSDTAVSVESMISAEQLAALPGYDKERSQAFRKAAGLVDRSPATTEVEKKAASMQRHSIYFEAVGRIFDPSKLGKAENSKGERSFYASFNLEVRRYVQNAPKLQPIRLRCTGWGDIAKAISAARPGDKVVVTGFLDPWWMVWSPSEEDPTKGKLLTLSESPDEEKDNRVMDPESLYALAEKGEWDYSSHLYKSFQGDVKEIAVGDNKPVSDDAPLSGSTPASESEESTETKASKAQRIQDALLNKE